MLRGVFYYHVIKWSIEELEQYSINVLEAHERDIGGRVFLRQARQMGLKITHTTAYVDNSAAEAIAESGKASTAVLNELNRRRLQHLPRRMTRVAPMCIPAAAAKWKSCRRAARPRRAVMAQAVASPAR